MDEDEVLLEQTPSYSVECLFENQDSSSDDPIEEWSSMNFEIPETNPKRILYAQGLYHPGSGNVCSKYIAMSDSSIQRHIYYRYPALADPGIEAALLGPEAKFTYGDDGQELYLALCEEMAVAPIKSFYISLLSPKINLNYYGISQKGFLPMGMALMKNTHVQVLDLTDNWICMDGCFHLGKMLAHNNSITELVLNGCRIGEEGAKVIFAHLSTNSMLKKLDVSRNELGDEGVEHLSSAIFDDAKIANLKLAQNELTFRAVIGLFQALAVHNHITHLDLSRNFITSPLAVLKLCQQIIENNNFKELNLSSNSLTGSVIGEAIALVLQEAKTVQYIYLKDNRLSGEAVKHIAVSLLNAEKLETLDLSHNPLTSEDALTLLDCLKLREVKLRCLLLENVTVDEEFMRYREEILSLKFRQNTVITHGYIQTKMVFEPRDMREILLKRANAIGRSGKKKSKRVDFVLLMLELYRDDTTPRPVKEFKVTVKKLRLKLDDDLIEQMAVYFPGSTGKEKSISLEAVIDYIKRLWPDKKLPPPQIAVKKSKKKIKKKK